MAFEYEDAPAKRSRFEFEDAAPPAKLEQLTRTDKFIRGMRDPIDGGAQLLEKGLQKFAPGILSAGNSAQNWVADKTGLVGRVPEGGVDQLNREAEQKYQAQRTAQGETGFDGARIAGNVLSPANLAIAARAPAAASLAGRMGIGAGVGAISGSLAPVHGEGDFWDEKTKQTAIGAAFGGALPMVTGGIARMISPNASKNANLKMLKDEGVRPTVGQTLGGAWNKAEEKFQSLPIVGDMIARARAGSTSQFETAAHNRALKPLGQSLPDGVSGRDAIQHTEGVLKGAYDDVLTRIGAIRPDTAFDAKLANLDVMVRKMLLPRAERMKFDSVLKMVKDAKDQNGFITSDAYKTLESSLSADARTLTSSQNIFDTKMAPAVQQLKAELQDMLKRQAGPLSDELKAVNAGWANFKRVQNAASKLGADEGQFTPAQFQSAVRAMDKSKDKGAFARGSALGQDLGDAGKSILTNKVPDSGTPARMFMGGSTLLAGGAVHPAVPLSIAAGALMYTSPMQRALTAAIGSRPALAQPAANAFRRASPMLVPASTQLGFGLLDQ